MMSHPLARRLTLAAVTAATAALPVAGAAAAHATTPHSPGLAPNVQPARSANASAVTGPASGLAGLTGPGGADISGHSTDPLRLVGQVSQLLGLGKRPGQSGQPGESSMAPSGGGGPAGPLGALGQVGHGDRVSGVTGLDSDQLLHSGLIGGVLKPLEGQQVSTGSLLDPTGAHAAGRAARPAARSLLPSLGQGNAGNDLLSQLTQLVGQMTSQGPKPTGQPASGITPAP